MSSLGEVGGRLGLRSPACYSCWLGPGQGSRPSAFSPRRKQVQQIASGAERPGGSHLSPGEVADSQAGVVCEMGGAVCALGQADSTRSGSLGPVLTVRKHIFRGREGAGCRWSPDFPMLCRKSSLIGFSCSGYLVM